MGRNGVYYRQTLGHTQRGKDTAGVARTPIVDPTASIVEDAAGMTVLELTQSSPSTLIDDLNAARARSAISPLAWLRGKRRVPVFFDVNDNEAAAFEELVNTFSGLRKSQGAWLLIKQDAVVTTYQRKTNAGASNLVSRSALTLGVDPPRVLVTNIMVPSLASKSFSIHLLPDQLVISRGKQFGGWPYRALSVRCTATRFIEEGRVPADAERVGTTWRYVNTKGGPDRRFKDNPVLPILAYAEVEITAGTGLRVLLQFSNLPAAQDFVEQLANMRTMPVTIQLPSAITG
jgi:hypothetical protein